MQQTKNQTTNSNPNITTEPSLSEKAEAAKAVLDKMIAESPDRECSASVGDYGVDRVELRSWPESSRGSRPNKHVASFMMASLGVLAVAGTVALGFELGRKIKKMQEDARKAAEKAAKAANSGK